MPTTPAPPPLDPKEALKHIRVLARTALDSGKDDLAIEHLEMILALVDKALPRRSSAR